jgi:hypothetical protein
MVTPLGFVMNRAKLFWLIVFSIGPGAVAGCSSDDDAAGSVDGPQDAQENVQRLPPIGGTPVEAGYFDGGVTLLRSADPDSGVTLMPINKNSLLAVRLDVDKAATLVVDEYFVIIGKRRYRPKGIAFGDARQTFFDVKKFVGNKVKLSLGGSDEITTSDAGQLNGYQLSIGEIYLLYRVPVSSFARVQYDGKDYELRPITAAALGVEASTTPITNNGDTGMDETTGPKGLQLEVKRGQLAIATIDGEEVEVFELELTLKGSKYEQIELKFRENFFLQGNAIQQSPGGKGRRRGKRTRRVFVELQEDRMRLIQGTDYYDNTYKDRPMKELVSGGLSVSVEPGQPLTMFFVFPNPPFENGLSLHFPGKPLIDVVPVGDVLGEIRPAIPRGVAKIPRAPIVGIPVKLTRINGDVTVVGGNNSDPLQPGAGKRFLAIRFTIEGERQFVARDYVLRDESNANYYPVAVAFGRAAARRIPGDGYEAVKLIPGETDVARRKKGQLLYWQYAHPEFFILFAVPDGLTTAFFSHGNRLLKLTPLSSPVSWTKARPNATIATKPNTGRTTPNKSANKNKPSQPNQPASTAGNSSRAASKLRLGKLLLKTDAQKARTYFQEAIRLAPGSPIAKEAKQLLDGLK